MTTKEQKKEDLVTELRDILRDIEFIEDYSLEEIERDIKKALSNLHN